MTTTTLDATTVIGHALYIEAQRLTGGVPGKYVTQILLTPEYVMPSSMLGTMAVPGVTVPMMMHRRTLTPERDRRPWRHYGSASTTTRALERFSGDQSSSVTEVFSIARSTVDKLVNEQYPYTLVGKPIVVEVSRADMEEVRLGKTPYKVLGRIWKVRKALGYPEKFV